MGQAEKPRRPLLETAEFLREHRSWRPDWAMDRTLLWWYLTFERESALESLMAEIDPILGTRESVDPVPVRWLHLTLEEVGPPEEVTAASKRSLLDEAADRTADIAPLRVSLGPVSTTRDAVVLQAGPATALSALRQRLAAVTASVLGRRRENHDAACFRPHVTVGYVNRECERTGVVHGLDESVPDLPREVVVPEVTLAAVTRRNGFYEWRPEGSVAFR